MKLSTLLKRLYEASEHNSMRSLAETTGISKGLVERSFAGQNTVKKLDVVFEELTKDLEVEDIVLAIKLIKTVKQQQHEI